MTVPGEVAALARGAAYAQMARACEDIAAQGSLKVPGDVSGRLAQFDRARSLLDALGWDRRSLADVEVSDAHRAAVVETLEGDRDQWEGLAATQETAGQTEWAARNIAAIDRFLVGQTGR